MTLKTRIILNGCVNQCRIHPSYHGLFMVTRWHRAHQIMTKECPQEAVLNRAQRMWTFPNGSTLTFATVEGRQHEQYLSSEFHFVDYGATTVSPDVMALLESRVRSRAVR